MSPCLVVLTDFFAVTNRALSYAAGLAVPLRAHLLLLHVHRDALLAPADFSEYHTWGGEQKAFYAIEKLAAHQSVPTEVDVSDDSLADAVREVVQLRQPLLVVLGQPGFEGAPPDLAAHTALGLLRQAPCPLLIVPAAGWDGFPPRHLLLAVDGEPFELGPQQSVVNRLLRATQGTLDVVYVTDEQHEPPDADAVLATITQNDLQEAPFDPSRLHALRHPHVVSAVLEEAARQQADLLVVVARRRSYLGSLFHRSTTARLLHESPIPVLLLPAET